MRTLMFFLLAFFAVFTCIRVLEKPDNTESITVMSAQVPAVKAQAEIPMEIVN